MPGGADDSKAAIVHWARGDSNGRWDHLEPYCTEEIKARVLVNLQCKGTNPPTAEDLGSHGFSSKFIQWNDSHGSTDKALFDSDAKSLWVVTGIRCSPGKLLLQRSLIYWPHGLVFCDPEWEELDQFCEDKKIWAAYREIKFNAGSKILPGEEMSARCCEDGGEEFVEIIDPGPFNGTAVVGVDMDLVEGFPKCFPSTLWIEEVDSHGGRDSWVPGSHPPALIPLIDNVRLENEPCGARRENWVIKYDSSLLISPLVTIVKQVVEQEKECCNCCDSSTSTSTTSSSPRPGEGSSTSTSSSSESVGEDCPSPPCPDGWVEIECCEGSYTATGIDECMPETLTVSLVYSGTGCSGTHDFTITWDGLSQWTGNSTWTDQCGNSRTTSATLTCSVPFFQLILSDTVGISGSFNTTEGICCGRVVNIGTGNITDACPALSGGGCTNGSLIVFVSSIQ